MGEVDIDPEPESARVPDVIVVLPEKEFTPESVNTPAPVPDFVKFFPEPLITPVIVTPAVPSMFIMFSVLFPNKSPKGADPPLLIVKTPAELELLFLIITLFIPLTVAPFKFITGDVTYEVLLLLIFTEVAVEPEIENAPK